MSTENTFIHINYCKDDSEPQAVETLNPNSKTKFKNVHQELKVPLIVYVDFEAIIENVESVTI